MQDIHPTCNFPLYIFVADQHEAPSTHIHFCLKTECLLLLAQRPHVSSKKWPLKTHLFKNAFRVEVLHLPFCCTHVDVQKWRFLETITLRSWIPVNAYASVKDGSVSSQVIFSLLDRQKRTLCFW